MLVTRAEDRFGNWVTYHYSNGIVDTIAASDGRRVTLTNDGTNITAITVASSTGDRTWQYRYANGALSAVVQPDGASWAYALSGLSGLRVPGQHPSNCSNGICGDGLTGDAVTGAITTPAGATATYAVRVLHVGRSYTPKSNLAFSDRYQEYPKENWQYAISAKTVSGPGLSPATWRYDYSPGNASWDVDCANGCAMTVWSDVTYPDGTRNRSVFSNRVDGSENLLLRTEVHAAGSDALVRATDYTYAITPPIESNSPYPWRSVGGDFTPRNNLDAAERWTPILSTKTTQEGTEFNQTVNSYDIFARPLSITRASPWHSRTDVTAYYDNNAKWILGAQASSTNSNTGMVEPQTTYNDNAQPVTVLAFGKLQQTLSYNANGTLASSRDGSGNTTTFASWKRGLPQSVGYADGSAKSAVIDDNGWIAAATDENGYTTTYGYDAMGRLTRIAYPAGDSTAWNATLQTFESVPAAEYGIAAGHWRQTVTTGNARKLTYFDAFWRPLLTREYDAADEAGTQRFQRFAYDDAGRVTFASYPGSSDTLSTGAWTSYDAIGRTTSVSQDSESGLLTTLTEYLPGNQTRVTDPRGNKTVAGYQVFDQPSYDKPVWILHPEGARTDIARDVFGNVTQLVRGRQ